MTIVEVLEQRLDEAIRVREAYQVQVGRRRRAWREAAPAAAEQRVRDLLKAMEQLGAAKEAERLARRAWQEVSGGRARVTV